MQHLEEGTIHAWIDGALSPAEARDVEAHVAVCEECARSAAEARGLVAASSRILMALDDVPGNVIPAGTAPATAKVDDDTITPIQPARRRPWHTPFWIRTAAAVVVIAGTSALVMTAKLNNPETELKRPEIALVAGVDSAAVDAAMSVESQASEPAAGVAVASPPPPQTGQGVPSTGSAGRGAASTRAAPVQTRDGALRDAPAARAQRLSDATGNLAAATDMRGEGRELAERARAASEESRVQHQVAESTASGEARSLQVQRAAAPALTTSADAVSKPDTLSAFAERRAAPAAPTVQSSSVARKAAKAVVGAVTAPLSGTGASMPRGAAAPSSSEARMPSAVAAFAPPIRGATGEHPAVGCYELSLTPWSGGTIPFGAPPARIELDSLTSVQDAIRGLNLVHPAVGAASNGAPLAYWGVLADSVYVTWRDESRGVMVKLPFRGRVLRGSARTFSMSQAEAPQSSTVEARRINCRD